MTLNFDTICRTCMTQSQALLGIFDEQDSPENDVLSMLQSITSIRVSEILEMLDSFPKIH